MRTFIVCFHRVSSFNIVRDDVLKAAAPLIRFGLSEATIARQFIE